MRLVASFPLWFTTSIDVLCSKFSGVWETRWIFKAARWTHDRCTKINKSPTVSNGIRASSFEIWTANLAQSLTLGTLTNSPSFIFGDSKWTFCKAGYPVGTLKPVIQMQTFLIWGEKKIMLLFLSEKNSNLLKPDKNNVFANWENTKWAETFIWCLLLIFKVGYRDHLTQWLPFAWDFVA